MRPTRFRLRTLMVAVAAVGFGIGGWVEANRSSLRAANYRMRARQHASLLAGLPAEEQRHLESARQGEATLAHLRRMEREGFVAEPNLWEQWERSIAT